MGRKAKPFDYWYTILPNGCWQWQGSVSNRNYGVYSIPGIIKRSKTVNAHRYSFELVKGSIAPNMVIDHLCRNTLCVNPEHLEAVTQSLNVKRGNGSKITQEIADLIKKDSLAGDTGYKIAVRYGISDGTVSNIITGKQWK